MDGKTAVYCVEAICTCALIFAVIYFAARR